MLTARALFHVPPAFLFIDRVTELDLLDYFKQFGALHSINLIKNKRIGFVNFLDKSAEDTVVEQQTHTLPSGKRVTVKHSEPKINIRLRGVPSKWLTGPTQDLQAELERVCGPVQQLSVEGPDVLLTFVNFRRTEQAYSKLKEYTMDGVRISKCEPAVNLSAVGRQHALT